MDKLQLTVPIALLDLLQQLGNSDVMQFEASSWSGGLFSVMLQRQGIHVTISIDGVETPVAETIDDRWCCGLKTITSNVLLTMGALPVDSYRPIVSTPTVDTSLPPSSSGGGGGGGDDESAVIGDSLTDHVAPPTTADVLQLAACQTIPLVSTLNQTQLQLICSGITEGIDGKDVNIVDALNNDAWRSLLDTADIGQPAEQSEAVPDGETVMTEMGSDLKPNQPSDAGHDLVQCNLCGNSYQLFGSLYKHVREIHRDDPRYRDALKHIQHVRFQRLKRKSALVLDCWLCGEQCFGHQLFKHISVVHGERGDVDALMDRAKKLYGREARAVYKRVAPGNVRVSCAHCHRSFAKKYVKRHEVRCRRLDVASSAARLQCNVCSKQFTSRKAVYEHRRRVHRLLAGAKLMRTHKCHICGREFPAPAKLRCHMTTHTGVRNYRCEVCGRAFKDAYTMRHHHKTVHLGQYRFHCSKCSRNFDKLHRLNHHRCVPNIHAANNAETENGTRTESDGGTFSTEGSGRNASSTAVSRLSSYDMTSDTKRDVTCDLCSKVCRDTVTFKNHRRIVHHIFITKPTPKFTCDVCKKEFASRAKLTAHLHTHSETRQYVCEVCRRAFKDPYTMKHHHQTQHLRMYRFCCDVCGRPFDKRSHLKRHRCNPAVTKSFQYRTSSPMTTCSESLTPSDRGKEKVINQAKKRCRRSRVEGGARRGSDRRNTPVDVNSKQCDEKRMRKHEQYASKNQMKIKQLNVPSDVDAKSDIVDDETDETYAVLGNGDGSVTVKVLPQPRRPNSVVAKEPPDDLRDREEISSMDLENTTDSTEEIRSGVVAECVQSAGDDQRVFLAYQVTAPKRNSGNKRKNKDCLSPVSYGGATNKEQYTPGSKTPGSILVTFLPAHVVKNQQLSHTLSQCDAVTDEHMHERQQRTPTGSLDSYEELQSVATGNSDTILSSPALHKITVMTPTKGNGPAEIETGDGASSLDQSNGGIDATEQLTRQRTSLRREHRGILKVQQT